MKGVDWLIHRFVLRNLPDVAIFSAVLAIQAIGLTVLLRSAAAKSSRKLRLALMGSAFVSFAALAFGFLLRFNRVMRYLPRWWADWGRGMIIAWALVSVLLVVALLVSRIFSERHGHSQQRRNFLRFANLAIFGGPAAAMGYGIFIGRTDLKLREQSITIPGLHPDLDGLRIVQLTDIHLSVFLPERILEQAVGLANETRAHIALVTGDLISFRGDPLDACLARMGKLRADSGVWGCMGNHEIYARTEDYTEAAAARLGMRFLRHRAEELRFGNAKLNLAGVDYQHLGSPYLKGADRLVRPGALNVLLSHNPDVFPVAARQGWDLTLAGHTHGGQVKVEILRQDLSVARFFTRYVDGLYRDGSSSIFVSRGIGTIGLPARLGAPPEVALIKLCRT